MQDLWNLTGVLKFYRDNEDELEKLHEFSRARDPKNPWYARDFSSTLYGVVEALGSAQVVLLWSAIDYYAKQASNREDLCAKQVVELFKYDSKEFTMRYDTNHVEKHVMAILTDIRHQIVHRKDKPTYKILKTDLMPLDLLLRETLTMEFDDFRLLLIREPGEQKDRFFQRCHDATQRVWKDEGLQSTHHKSRLFAEPLIDECVSCVRSHAGRLDVSQRKPYRYWVP